LPILNVSYHTKYYALGCHYNSIIPVVSTTTDSPET